MTEERDVLSYRVKVASKVLLVVWLLCMSLVVLGGMITLIDGKISFDNPDFKYLNNVGGFFNIVTSLAGVATVWLLAEAILLQKKELKDVSESMKGQNDKLREQIDSSKEEEKINRAMKLYDEWLEIKNRYSSEKESTFEEVLEKYNPLVYYVVRITRIRNSSFSMYINFDVLKDILDKEGVLKTLELAISKIESMKSEVEEEKNKEIRARTENGQGNPFSKLSEKQREKDAATELQGVTLLYCQNIESFRGTVTEFKNAFE